MMKALHSDIGHAGNKGEDKKLDMKLSNLESMKKKSESLMSLQKKSFIAEMDKRQKTWVREHGKRASKINKQAKLRKEIRMKIAEEDAKKVQEKLEKEDDEIKEKLNQKKEIPKIERVKMLQRRKSILPSLEDIAEPVQTPPPPKENRSVSFKRMAKAIGLAGVTFGKMTKVQGYEDDEENGDETEKLTTESSLFRKKIAAALKKQDDPEKLSFSNLVLKLREKKERQFQETMPTIDEKKAADLAKIEAEKKRRIVENQKLPPLLRRGSIVNSVLKEAEDNELSMEVLKREQSFLSGPEPIFISENLPKIDLIGEPKLNKQQIAAKRRRRKRRRRGNHDLTKEKEIVDPLTDDRFVKLQYMLKPELKKKHDDKLSSLTQSVMHAKKYARWWRAATMNSGVIHEEYDE